MTKRRSRGEGSLRKRSDGRWEGRYTVGRDEETGKLLYRNVLAKTQAECKAKLREAIRNTQQPDIVSPDKQPENDAAASTQYTVGEWLRMWYELYSKPNLRETTQEQYTNFLEKHVIPHIGNIALDKLTSLRLQKLYQELRTSGRVNVNRNASPGLSPKTVRGIHMLLHNALEQAVDLLVQEHELHPDNPYMFPSPVTGTMYHPDAATRIHRKILKESWIEHIRFHDLCHTFAILALQNGVDIKTLSGMLGHYSSGFTLDTYTHVTDKMQREAAKKMGSFMEMAR